MYRNGIRKVSCTVLTFIGYKQTDRQAKFIFKEFEPRFKSAKTRFKLSTGLNLETFDKILSGTSHISAAA